MRELSFFLLLFAIGMPAMAQQAGEQERNKQTARSFFEDVLDQGRFDIVELLVKVTSKQQHGIFQLTPAVFERALPETADHDSRSDHDGGDQQNTGDDKPANWIALARSLIVE